MHSSLVLISWIAQALPQLPSEHLGVVFQKAGVCLLIGALVGLERERSIPDTHKLFAGIRTFPLIALFGFLSALLGHIVSVWLLVVFSAGFSGLVIASYIFEAKEGYYGATSEVSALIVFLLGTLVYWEMYVIAIAAGVVLTVFLSLKAPLQAMVGRIREEDIYATLKFAIITAIVLPVLPDATFGPFDVLNPRQIWYMVVLIAGISFLGYVLVKVLGSEKGIALSGLLGGLVSSTAVTLSFSQKSRTVPDLSRLFAASIILACSIMYPRIVVEVAVVNPMVLRFLWPFLLGLFVTGTIASAVFLFGAKKSVNGSVELENPFELSSAIKFGLIFAVILFASKAAQVYFGNNGLYFAAAIAGATDVDAITLSMANLAKDSITEKAATTAILIAVAVNTAVKAGLALSLGSIALRKKTVPGFGALLLVALGMIGFLILT